MSCLAVTGEVSESKQFEWKIADYSSLSIENGAFYSSPSFVFDNISLHLDIYPGGDKDYLSRFPFVILKNENGCPLNAFITVCIKKADGTFIADRTNSACTTSVCCFWILYDRFFLLQNNPELLPSGIFTIVCILKKHQDEKPAIETSGKAEISHEKQKHETSNYRRLTELDVLSKNLKDISTNKDSCDVVLEVEEKEFKAHRAILMARSSVFAAMFQHDTLEKQTGIIKISDCDSESFQEFLDYLYSGKLEDVSFRSAFHLYSTSNKYDVEKLKDFCIGYLMESLTVDNMCDIVKLADKYDETKLITKIQDFFNENWCKIFLTTEWETLMTNNSRLANKLLVELSKSKSSQ